MSQAVRSRKSGAQKGTKADRITFRFVPMKRVARALAWSAAALALLGEIDTAAATAPRLGDRRLRWQQRQRAGRAVRSSSSASASASASTAASAVAHRRQLAQTVAAAAATVDDSWATLPTTTLPALLELRQDPMTTTDKCFWRHQLDCGGCTKDPACGMCTNELGQRKCMEGGAHGPRICHLEDCRSWIYTSCDVAGITPTTCRESPPKPPPKRAPPARKEPTAPVKVVEAVPPEPAPVEDSIIPGLAREERIETVKLEEESKHPESVVVAEHKSDFDKRNEAME